MSDKNQEFQKNVNEQAGVEGDKKEINVGDYPKATALGQLLKDIEFHQISREYFSMYNKGLVRC